MLDARRAVLLATAVSGGLHLLMAGSLPLIFTPDSGEYVRGAIALRDDVRATSREAVVLDEGATARFRKTADSGREIDIVRCAACGTPQSAQKTAYRRTVSPISPCHARP